MIEGMAEPTLFCKKLNHQAELFSFKKSDKQTNKWHIYKALYILQVKHLSSICNVPQTMQILLPNLKNRSS